MTSQDGNVHCGQGSGARTGSLSGDTTCLLPLGSRDPGISLGPLALGPVTPWLLTLDLDSFSFMVKSRSCLEAGTKASSLHRLDRVH